MEDLVPFSDVIELLESCGWQLSRIWNPYRVFTKPGSSTLPILVEVHDRMVKRGDVERIKKQIKKTR